MKPKDRIALVIATGIVSWGVLAIGGLTWRDKPLNEGGAEVFVAIGGAMAAMLATYFASKNGEK